MSGIERWCDYMYRTFTGLEINDMTESNNSTLYYDVRLSIGRERSIFLFTTHDFAVSNLRLTTLKRCKFNRYLMAKKICDIAKGYDNKSHKYNGQEPENNEHIGRPLKKDLR